MNGEGLTLNVASPELARPMHDHVILIGYGRIGRKTAAKVSRAGIDVLVVDTDPTCCDAAEAAGLPVLRADPSCDATLQQAALPRSRSLVAALPSNLDNLYVVFSARAMDRDSRLIALAESEEEARKLFLAGANEAVQPQPGIGQKVAALALQPPGGSLAAILSHPDCVVREFRLTSKKALVGVLSGATLGGLRLGAQTGAMVLAIRSPRRLDALSDLGKGSKPGATEFVMANPIDEVRLEPGQTLVVLGSRSQLQQVQELLGPLVE